MEIQKKSDVRTLMGSEIVKSKFTEILGKNAASFMASVVQLSNKPELAKCEPKSILSAAIIAASLNLSVDPSLGQAAIIPFGSNATFQIMYKGLIQLALRSGQVVAINSCAVYDDELQNYNKLTGAFDLTGEKKSDTIIGYAGYIRLANGFEKCLFMAKSDIEKHGKRYSKMYGSGVWKTDFDKMAEKTILKMILSKYCPLSTEMQMAIKFDQTTTQLSDSLNYDESEIIESDFKEAETIVETPKLNLKEGK